MPQAKHQTGRDAKIETAKRIIKLQDQGLSPAVIKERLGMTQEDIRKYKPTVAQLRAAEAAS
jgi:DNA-binding transcriptional MerR regulator